MSVVDFGIVNLRYVSDSLVAWKNANGAAQAHLCNSDVAALMYGRFARSEKSGNLSLPTTSSSSFCACLIHSGCLTAALKNHCNVVAVVSVPAVNNSAVTVTLST